MVPQKLPALTTQVGAVVGTAIEVDGVLEVLVTGGVVVAGLLVVVGVVIGLLLVEVGALDDVAVLPAGVRYQFSCGSPRHSPAVTPFQPLAWMRP